MSPRVSSLLALFAAVLVAVLVVTASAAAPRCEEDGRSVLATAFPAVLRGGLTYNGESGCAEGQSASFDIVARNAAPSTMVKLSTWSYIVALRDGAPAVYTLGAKCGAETICEAEVTFAVSSK